MKGRHSIRVNDQYRVTFRWENGHAFEVAVEDYHRDPNWLGPAVAPGEILLEEFLKPLELGQVEAARRLEISLNRMNEIVLGKRGITADTALRLARLFEMSPEFWMGLQVDWDLWHAAHALRRAG